MLTSTNICGDFAESTPDGQNLSEQKIKQTIVDDVLIEYVDALQAIDEHSPLAKLNAVSISDNNGGRIYF